MSATDRLTPKWRKAVLSYCRFFSVSSFPKVFLKDGMDYIAARIDCHFIRTWNLTEPFRRI